MVSSSSGPGLLVLIQAIAGSNPAEITIFLGFEPAGFARRRRIASFSERHPAEITIFYVIITDMSKLPIVALIGQTNAGKSSILNRMARKNIAIVAREEGTTRDNVVTKIDNQFILVDTAGLKDPSDDFEASIQDQILDAIESADVILVTLDSAKYFDHRDAKIAKSALRSGKPVYLILNKCDLGESLSIENFRALGIAPERTFYVSATTGQGMSAFKRQLEDSFSRVGVPRARLHGARTPYSSVATSGFPRRAYLNPIQRYPNHRSKSL